MARKRRSNKSALMTVGMMGLGAFLLMTFMRSLAAKKQADQNRLTFKTAASDIPPDFYI